MERCPYAIAEKQEWHGMRMISMKCTLTNKRCVCAKKVRCEFNMYVTSTFQFCPGYLLRTEVKPS